METALNGALSVSLDTFYTEDHSLSGLVSISIKPVTCCICHMVFCQTFSQYWKTYSQRGEELGLNYNRSDPTFFDAMWVYAIALNKTIQGTCTFMQ